MARNPSTPAARNYAEALIDIGNATGTLGRIHDDLMALVELYETCREFRAFFTSPRIDPDLKYRIIRESIGDRLCRPVLGLIKVMIRKRRELLLDNIAAEFTRFKDLSEGKLHVHVRTARPLDETQKKKIVDTIVAKTGQDVRLHEEVAPELIGGTVVRVGDVVVDGSLRRKLAALRKRLVAGERLY